MSNQTQTNQILSTNKSTHITAKSEVSQHTAISDRPKAKPKNSRKQKQVQSETIVSLLRNIFANLFGKCGCGFQVQPPASSYDQKPLQTKSESEIQQQPQPEVSKVETPQEVPQSVPEASSTAILTPEEKEKASDGTRACSLIDLETFQKMRLNNLSNRSAHWDPKVFRKIAQLIDPPKSPTETPPESSNSTRPNTPDTKNIESESYDCFRATFNDQFCDFIQDDMAELTHIFDHLPALQSLSGDPNLLQGKFVRFLNALQSQFYDQTFFQKKREPSKEDLEKTLATLSEMNASDFVCDGTYPSLEESLESFNPDDVAAVNAGDDAHGQIYNYEWVDEVMQALNVSPDISNAFHVSFFLTFFIQ